MLLYNYIYYIYIIIYIKYDLIFLNVLYFKNQTFYILKKNKKN